MEPGSLESRALTAGMDVALTACVLDARNG